MITLFMVRPLRNRFVRYVGPLIGKHSVVSVVGDSYGGNGPNGMTRVG